MRPPNGCTKRKGTIFPVKQKFDSKTQVCLTIYNRNAFSKASHLNTFPRRVLSKNSDNDTHLETLKDSNEDFIKVNQIISYTKCKLRHCTPTNNKKMLVRSRIFVINIQSHV